MPLRPPAGYIRPGYNPLQVANAPTVGTASAGDTTASVAFTAPSNVGGGAISLYYAVSSPGQFTGTSVTSPVTVTGLTNGTSYTFTVWAANPFGPSPYSASSNSVTPSPPFIEDVFSTWLYTGNGSTQTITNGIDLSGKGGLVWIKNRSSAYTHVLVDTNRGTDKVLCSNNTNAEQTGDPGFVTQFNSDGFAIGDQARVNLSSSNFASWTFRKQPKFFDVVTYTGDGNYSTDTPAPYGRAIAHSLTSRPGFIVIKATSTTSDWYVGARQNDTYWFGSFGTGTSAFRLNGTGGATQYDWATKPMADSTNFYPAFIGAGGSSGTTNDNGVTYVAYLFAHNAGGFGLTGTDNVISCGSYTGNGSSTGPSISLGYEPQWLMIKRAVGGTSSWNMYDTMRGMPVPTAPTFALQANLAGAEYTGPNNFVAPNATGFDITSTSSDVNTNGDTYIYIAIRRGPMKTPTTGTSVFDPEAYTGTSATRTITSGFPVDLSASKVRSQGYPGGWFDRLRGALQVIRPELTDAEATSANSLTGFDSMTGVVLGSDGSGRINTSPETYAMWNFRRAPGFFDVVCYTGTGSATTQAHNLGVVPELMIVKSRSLSVNSDWAVYNAASGNTGYTYLNDSLQVFNSGVFWNSTTPTASVFSIGTNSRVNSSGQTYVAYLFASCPGVSKVGSYTGTGALQTINCGFTGGARFVLIKRTDSTGDWFVYDSARGITSGNDPYLLMNSTAAEVTGTNYVDTTSVGFQVTAAAPAGLNANGGTYIFLAIA